MKQIEQLYTETKNGHIKLMSRILGGDMSTAEDVVQEAFCRALQYWPSYDPKRGPLKPWFNRIMFNALRDIQQEYNNRPKEDCEGISLEDVLSSNSLPETVVESIESVENDSHQRVLYLFYVLGYNSREISQIEEKMSQTNVTTIVNRFKEGFL